MYDKSTRVRNRADDKTGFLTGSRHRCQLAGCNGLRLSVKWPDGRHSFPCTKGMTYDGGEWRIL